MAKKENDKLKNAQDAINFLSESKKTPQHSKPPKKEKKTPVLFWEYRNLNSWRMVPYTMETMETLADHLNTWSKLADSYRISDFYDEHEIDEDTYLNMKHKCEKLQAAHKRALQRIASRREIGAMTGKLREATVFRSLPHYCSIDMEQAKYRIELAAKAKANLEDNEQKIVVIERMPSSKMVPEKK